MKETIYARRLRLKKAMHRLKLAQGWASEWDGGKLRSRGNVDKRLLSLKWQMYELSKAGWQKEKGLRYRVPLYKPVRNVDEPDIHIGVDCVDTGSVELRGATDLGSGGNSS